MSFSKDMDDLSTQSLRSFIAYHEAGSLAGASYRLGRSESAVSLQIKKLEEQLGTRLFAREGGVLRLTAQGELFLAHANAIVGRIDLARAVMSQSRLFGAIRVGVTQDFAGLFLIRMLQQFELKFPALRVDVIIERSSVLLRELGADAIDICLCSQPNFNPVGDATEPMIWLGDPNLCRIDLLPIATVSSPCPFRDASIAALERSGRLWHIAFETPSLDGVRAAVLAGVAIGCRTPRFLDTMHLVADSVGLPELPEVNWVIRKRRSAPELTSTAIELVIGPLLKSCANEGLI